MTIGKQNLEQNLDKNLHFGIRFDFGHIHLFNLKFWLLNFLCFCLVGLQHQENHFYLTIDCLVNLDKMLIFGLCFVLVFNT